QAALPAVEGLLVDQVEEAERTDVGIAADEMHDVRVVLRLSSLVDRDDVLRACIELLQRGGDRDLPARLVEVELEGVGWCRLAALREHRLPGAVEGVPDGLLDPVEVRDAGLRPRIALERRVVVLIRIRVEAG